MSLRSKQYKNLLKKSCFFLGLYQGLNVTRESPKTGYDGLTKGFADRVTVKYDGDRDILTGKVTY